MANPSLLIIPDRYKAAKLYSQLPESGDGDFVVTRSTTATRVNASGLIESVASGVPRLDYTGGGCPSLLVEPAATNLLLRSEEFDNASWTKTNLNTTATPPWVNVAVAPNGTTTAEKIIPNTSNVSHFILQGASITSGTTYTQSIYVKAAEYSFFQIAGSQDFDTNSFANFNLTNGTLGSFSGGVATIINAGNGWYRLTYTLTATGTSASGRFVMAVVPSSTSTRLQGFAGNDSDGLFVWGAQLETGSVATSYIPTVATTQTRNADVISRSSVSGLIGQSQGTIYAEINLSKLTGSRYIIAIVVNATNYFAIRTNASNAFIFRYRNGGSETTIPSIPNVSNSSTGIFKLALAYQDGNYAAAVNGTVYPSTASGIFPSGTFETVDLSFTTPLNDRITTAALYPTRLDNATLAQLTTL